MTDLKITVIQMNPHAYFWVLKNRDSIILASSRLIGPRHEVIEEAEEVNESLFMDDAVEIQER